MRKWLDTETEKNPKDIGAELKNRLLNGLGIEDMDFSFADMGRCELHHADFRRGIMRHARLVNSNLHECLFDRTDLRDSNLQRASLIASSFQYALMDNIRLESANLCKADLQEANLRRAKLSMSKMQKANLNGATLQFSNLSGADLRWASLCDTDLTGSNWQKAHLFQSVFNQSTLDKSGLNAADRQYWIDQGGQFISEAQSVSPGLWVQLPKPLPNELKWWLTAAAQAVDISIEMTDVDSQFIHIESSRCLLSLGQLLGSIAAGHENPLKNKLKSRMHPNQWIEFSDAFSHGATISLWTQGPDGVKKIEDWTHYDAELEAEKP